MNINVLNLYIGREQIMTAISDTILLLNYYALLLLF